MMVVLALINYLINYRLVDPAQGFTSGFMRLKTRSQEVTRGYMRSQEDKKITLGHKRSQEVT